ncbi:MAG TPA: cyclase family protein [Usitatibacter sp.]|nr:cyclase family protein [Usitatibacter sp.]
MRDRARHDFPAIQFGKTGNAGAIAPHARVVEEGRTRTDLQRGLRVASKEPAMGARHDDSRPITLRRNVGYDALRQVLERDRIDVRPGDILCIHTGFASELLAMNRQVDRERVHHMCAALDGTDRKLLDWISESRVSAIAADNYAVERIGLGAGGDSFVPLHYHCLFLRGIPLGELWYLSDLAAWLREHRRHSFMLTAPPLRLPGAVGSPVTPVANV